MAMRVKLLAPMIAVLGLQLAGFQPASAHSIKEFEDQLHKREKFVEIVDRPAPDFVLRDAEGLVVSFTRLRGKVVVLWFIYASCSDVCPLQSEELAAIQEQINRTPMRDLVTFVAVTTDPERDTPDVLSAYGPAHRLDPVNWMFLTSGPNDPAATRALAEKYGLQFTQLEDGYQMHGVVTHLIDKSGRLRARYHGLKFDPTNFILHVNVLTNDDH